MNHKANVLSKSEVEQGRSNAYQYLKLNTMTANQKTYKNFFKPCGEGENICNCTNESECGYIVKKN